MNINRVRCVEWHMVFCQLPSFEIADDNFTSSAGSQRHREVRISFNKRGKQQDD